MKKTLLTLVALVLVAFTFAQTPQAFKYQAVARTIAGEEIKDQNVRLRISIQQGIAFTTVYSETHLATTNSFGLFTLNIGEGTVQMGNFSTIDWSLGDYFVQLEMDETGGTNFDLIGTTSLLSVPYAIHAKTAESFSGIIPETDPVFSMSDAKSITSADINNWNSKLDAEVDGSTTNELQSISLSGKNLSISSGNTVDLSSITGIDTDDQTLSLSGTVLSIVDGNSVNLGLIDTKLSEAEVDSYVSNNGYLTSFTEVDGSTTNELQSLSLSGKNLSISSGNTIDLSSIDTDTKLSEAEVDSYVSNNGYLTSEVDGSTTNELQDISLSGTNLSISNGSTIDLASINTDDQTLVEILTANPSAGYKRITEVNVPANDWDVANKIYVDSKTLGDILTSDPSAGYNKITNLDYPTNTQDAANKGYVDSKAAAQTLSLSGSYISISGGNSIDLSSIDTDTKLSEAEVDSYVSNNGYLTSFTEVDGSTTNEIQSLSLSGSDLSISGGNSISLSSLVGTDNQTLSEVLTSGTDAGNKNIVNVAKVGIGTASPNASAALEITSTTQGFLPSRMTQAQRDLITPVEGLMVYNTTSSKPNFYNGTEWINFDGTSAKTLVVGVSYQGGIIAYVYQAGDPGYVAGETHGIIAATSDQSTGVQWYNGSYTSTTAIATALGTGTTNTTAITTNQGAGTYAAKICDDYAGGGYTDWVLPSRDDVKKLCLNRVSIGGFSAAYYWSSSEVSGDNTQAWETYFDSSAYQGYGQKNKTNRVRAVRYF